MKRAHLSYVLYGNLAYDRYDRYEMLEKCVQPYRRVLSFLERNPKYKGHVALSGMTALLLKRHAPDVLRRLRALSQRGQLGLAAGYYACPLNVCIDGISELTHLEMAVAVLRGLLGRVDGFFNHESAYHPQLPGQVRRAGLSWMFVAPYHGEDRPFRIESLDHTVLPAVPIHIGWDTGLSASTAKAGSLLVHATDFEMASPEMFQKGAELAERWSRVGLRTAFTRVEDYLRKVRLPAKKVFYSLGPSPAMARWVSDPKDIELHAKTTGAISAVAAAQAIAAYLRFTRGREADRPLADDREHPARWPLADCIEEPLDEPEVERKLLSPSGRLTALTRAEHLLLWGEGADARGHFPLLERRRERAGDLEGAALLATEVIQRGLSVVAQVHDAPGILVFNSGPARGALIETQSPVSAGIQDFQRRLIASDSCWDGRHYCIRFLADLPAWGWKGFRLTPQGQPRPPWGKGQRIRSGKLSVEGTGSGKKLGGVGTGIRLAWGEKQSFDLALSYFGVAEIVGGTEVVRYLEPEGPPTFEVRGGAFPTLRVAQALDKNLHLVLETALVGEAVRCRAEFDFVRPLLIVRDMYGGQSPEPFFDPWGITVRGRLSGTPRCRIFYDIPFGFAEHSSDEPGFVTGFTACGLEREEGGGGLVIAHRRGGQSFFVSRNTGEVSLMLGSSTIGGPPRRGAAGLEREGQPTHVFSFEREPFFGKYVHEWDLIPFQGGWRSAGIPQTLRAAYAEPWVSPGMPESGEGTLWRVEPEGVVVTGVAPREGRLTLILNEVSGKACGYHVQLLALDGTPIGAAKGRIGAHGVARAAFPALGGKTSKSTKSR